MDKKRLQEYIWLQKEATQLQERIEELEARATKQTSIITDEPRGTSIDKVDIILEIVELTKAYDEKKTEAVQCMIEIEEAIEKLPARERYLMRSRYIERKEWTQIAVDMSYSWRQVHRVHANALRSMKKHGTLCHTHM